MTISLESILQYNNPHVISRFEKDFPHTKLTANELFQELLKYIWLCQQHRHQKNQSPNNPDLQFTCVMHEEMHEIDYMWHTFLLFTQDYHNFCNDYLKGDFFHHHPKNDADNLPPAEDYQTELNLYLSYIYDNLGEETLVKWFQPALSA